MPFWCNDKVFKLCRRPMLDGICSMLLSHKFSACSARSAPIDSGMLRMRFPPSESRCRLLVYKREFASGQKYFLCFAYHRRRRKKNSLFELVDVFVDLVNEIAIEIQIFDGFQLQHLIWEMRQLISAQIQLT